MGTGQSLEGVLNPQPASPTSEPRLRAQLSSAATLTVTQAPAHKATITLRLPGWAGNLAEQAISLPSGVSGEVRDGYFYARGLWHEGDVITYDFAMPVRLLAANSQVREDAGKVAFTRGPVTFCAEQVDNGANLHEITIPVQRLNSEPSLITPRFAPDFQLGTSVTGATHEGAVELTTLPLMTLSVPALREVEEDSSALYHEWKPFQTQDVNLTLIPYFAWANRGENEMSVWLRAQ